MTLDKHATYIMPAHGWTCFFCGETFTTPGAAEQHFGGDLLATAACQIKAGQERGLVMTIRKLEAALARYQAEDSDKDREIQNIIANHQIDLRTFGDKEYAEGLEAGINLKTSEIG